MQLLCKDPVDRLGCVEGKHPIRKHLIFNNDMDWDLLENNLTFQAHCGKSMD